MRNLTCNIRETTAYLFIRYEILHTSLNHRVILEFQFDKETDPPENPQDPDLKDGMSVFQNKLVEFDSNSNIMLIKMGVYCLDDFLNYVENIKSGFESQYKAARTKLPSITPVPTTLDWGEYTPWGPNPA